MSVPASIINICSNVKLNNKYDHTIYFNSLSEQASYFAGKVVRTFSAYTYLRKSWSIKVEATMEVARTWSYLFFNNSSGKTYYYFINNVEYISDNTVELFLELDVMQTYHFDYTLLRSFVEREHVDNDTVGRHIIEETVNLGDLRVIDETHLAMDDLCVLVLTAYDPMNTTEDFTDTVIAVKYDNVFSGLMVVAVRLQDWQAWGTKLKLLDDVGKTDGIITMWMYPQALVKLADGESWEDGAVSHRVAGFQEIFKDVGRNTKTSGAYNPRNKKLLTYPFNFLYVTNNNGGGAVYRYERFGNPEECNFKVIGALSPEGQAKIYPINYNGIQHNYEEGLIISGYPTCAWNQDTYKLWLAQNQNQQNLALAVGGIKIVGGIVGMVATGGMGAMVSGGAVGSGAMDIANIMAQRKDMEVQPPQAKGNASGSVNVAGGFQRFTIQRKSIGFEFASVIDDYFDLYGYQINEVKIPNRKVRENWTYTKTVGCHIQGNFANEDIVKIESIFDKGITFWVSGDNICNYSLSNNTL